MKWISAGATAAAASSSREFDDWDLRLPEIARIRTSQQRLRRSHRSKKLDLPPPVPYHGPLQVALTHTEVIDMGKINWGRVLGGGLLAGVVLNAWDFVINGLWLKNDWNTAMHALGKGDMDMSMIKWFIVYDFIVGIWLV